MPSPLQAHSATPAELRERIEAERRGRPFLVFRDGDGAQRLLDLGVAGARERRPRQRQRAEPALGHGGLAPARRARGDRGRVDGQRRRPLAQRHLRQRRAHLGPHAAARRRRPARRADLDRLPPPGVRGLDARPRSPASGSRSATCRRPSARCSSRSSRPYKHDEFAAPATNQEIADELHLSVDAVKSHLRTLFQRFGIEHLPQNQKRSRLVAEALQAGVVSTARPLDACSREGVSRWTCAVARRLVTQTSLP